MKPPRGQLTMVALFALTTMGVALGLDGMARAGDGRPRTAEEIVDALKTPPADGSAKLSGAAQVSGLARLKSKATLSLSTAEREEVAQAVNGRPAIDLEVYFDYNSAAITAKAKPVLNPLGIAFQNPALKGATFLIAGHTDASGSATYNQRLSEQRAEAVKAYLHEKFSIEPERLSVIGYGFERLKNTDEPRSADNRRVEIINITETQSATAR